MALKRYIKEKFSISCGDSLYRELCDEYEQILSHEDSGRGLETEDIDRLNNADFFHEYLRIQGVEVKKKCAMNRLSKILTIFRQI